MIRDRPEDRFSAKNQVQSRWNVIALLNDLVVGDRRQTIARDLADTWQRHILVGEDRVLQRPIDPDIGIVP